jgi:hypothetical protein
MTEKEMRAAVERLRKEVAHIHREREEAVEWLRATAASPRPRQRAANGSMECHEEGLPQAD